MKTSLAFFALLFFAISAQAQHHHSHGASSSNGGGIQWSFGGQLGGYTLSSREHALQYEPPREFALCYATNDGEYVPSTYMNYDEAVALGRQQVAAAEQRRNVNESPSLGEIARAYRASKTLKLEARLIEGDSRNLEVCNRNGNTCRRL